MTAERQIDLFCGPELIGVEVPLVAPNGGSASVGYTAVAYRIASPASLAMEAQLVRHWVRVPPRRKLPDGNDDLAFGVPFAEIAQRLGH